MLKYDSILGTFKADVKIVDNETISVDGKLIKVVSNRDPLQLPWAELGIDIVIEVITLFRILLRLFVTPMNTTPRTRYQSSLVLKVYLPLGFFRALLQMWNTMTYRGKKCIPLPKFCSGTMVRSQSVW